MYRAVVLAALFAAALSAACGDGEQREEIASGAGPLALRVVLEEEVYHIRWDALEGGNNYRVQGTATYWPLCVEDRPSVTDKLEFGRLLSPGETEYPLPGASVGPDFYLRELEVDVTALGQDGSEVQKDSMAFSAESARCN